jgi:hypothetical protein
MMSIEKVVQKQIEYYNNQDIEGFESTYADDITVYTFPDNTITLSGKQALEECTLNRLRKNRIYCCM